MWDSNKSSPPAYRATRYDCHDNNFAFETGVLQLFLLSDRALTGVYSTALGRGMRLELELYWHGMECFTCWAPVLFLVHFSIRVHAIGVICRKNLGISRCGVFDLRILVRPIRGCLCFFGGDFLIRSPLALLPYDTI